MIKNQHYVPQFYLRRFAVDDQIWAYDKRSSRSLLTNVRNVASERYFYDIRLSSSGGDHSQGLVSAPDPQFVEEAFQRFDDGFSQIIASVLLTADRGESLTVEQRSMMAFCAAVQLLRTKATRESIVALYKHQNGEVSSRTDSEGQAAGCLTAYREGDAPLIHAELIFDMPAIEQIQALLVNRIWLLGVNESKHGFYTSDTPVVLASHLPSRPGSSGLGSPGTSVMLPLTPKYLLTMFEREFFAGKADLDGKTHLLDPDTVAGCNMVQVGSSDRWVYCAARDFELADCTCADHPEWREPFEPDWTSEFPECDQ